MGDAKYKNLTERSLPNEDLYQLLAYVTALELPGGLLVYAGEDVSTATYEVRHSGKSLRVATLDLSVPLEDILAQIGEMAGMVREFRRQVPFSLV